LTNSCFTFYSSVCTGPLFESREFQHSGNSDLDVYHVEKEMLKKSVLFHSAGLKFPERQADFRPLW
jgi:hypothetical protein